MSICKYCLSDENNSHFFNYKSLFHFQFIVCDKNISEILSTYHNMGYTIIHSLFYNYSRERYEHRDPKFSQECKKIIIWLGTKFKKEFQEACKIGLEEDNGNTPLHDYIKNIAILKQEDLDFINWLEKQDLDFSIKDNLGFTFMDYVNMKKKISKEIISKIRIRQAKMKMMEATIIVWCLENFKSFIKCCDICKCHYQLFTDIDNIPQNIWFPKLNFEIQNKIESIITLRMEIMDLYPNTSQSVSEKHLEIIKIWKNKIIGLPK
jgi:hypothetical protein